MEKDVLKLIRTTGILAINSSDYLITKKPIKKGEVEVGELAELEKNCLVFIDRKTEEYEALVERMEQVMDPDSETMEELTTENSLVNIEISFASDLLWLSIMRRVKTLKGHNSLAFRNGNKIVSLYQKEKKQTIVFGALQAIGSGW